MLSWRSFKKTGEQVSTLNRENGCSNNMCQMLRRDPKLYRFSDIPTGKNKKMKITFSRRGRRERRDGREKAALNNPLNRFFSFSALSAASSEAGERKALSL
jgi:hypothetical protein